MKPEEETAEKYLSALSLGPVTYEPDGNVPPDFKVGKSLGVEVRRLNQSHFGRSDVKGLEELSIPLRACLEEVLRSFDKEYAGNSYWVVLNYHRPLSIKLSKLKDEMRVALRRFLDGRGTVPCRIKVSDNLAFRIYPSRNVMDRLFRHAGSSDRNSGGWLVPVYISNISHCLTEKSKKISGYKPRYQEWWLLLVDRMAWGLDVKETQEVSSAISQLGNFDKLIVIDQLGNKLLLEILAPHAMPS